jgi:hypothetical protein
VGSRDRGSFPQQGHREKTPTSLQLVPSSKEGERTTIGDIIKIGTTEVIINGNNEGPMNIGKSAETNEEKIRLLPLKQLTPNTSCLGGAHWD